MPKRKRGGLKQKARFLRKLELQREQIKREGSNPGNLRVKHTIQGPNLIPKDHIAFLLKERRLWKGTVTTEDTIGAGQYEAPLGTPHPPSPSLNCKTPIQAQPELNKRSPEIIDTIDLTTNEHEDNNITNTLIQEIDNLYFDLNIIDTTHVIEYEEVIEGVQIVTFI